MIPKTCKILLLSVFAVLPFSDLRTIVFDIPMYVHEWLVLVSGAIFLVGSVRKEIVVKALPQPIVIGSLLLLFGTASSVAWNGVTVEALGALKSWFVFPLAFAFLLYQSFDSRNSRGILFVWFLSAVGVALPALFSGGTFPETYDGRVRLHYPSPNHLAFVVEYGLVIGFWFLRSVRKKEELLLLLIFELLLVFVLMETRSAGALIASVAGIGALLFFERCRTCGFRVVALILSVAAMVLLIICLNIDWEALSSGEIRTPLASRVMIWNAAAELASRNPVFGIGPRNFQEAYLSLQPAFPPYLEWAVPHPHNVFLAFWLSTGLAGVVGFCMLVFFSLFKTTPTKRNDPISGAVFPLLSVFLIHGLVDVPHFKNDLAFLFFSMVALAAISSPGKNEKER